MAGSNLSLHGPSLFWRVCLTNSAVFAAGTAILAASPATISTPIVVTEIVVVGVGVFLILLANGLLLRSMLGPLDLLIRRMETVDLLQPDAPLPEASTGAAEPVLRAFNAMLDRLEAERGSSVRRALAAQESERRRLAQELHDEVGQSLTAVLLGLSRIAESARGADRDEVLLAQETTRTSLEEVRRMARRLRPGVLDDLGLVASLSALASETSRLTEVEIHPAVDPALPRLDPDVELVLYRIAQEALTNVVRHAAAGRITLSLDAEPGGVVLTVQDDGVGRASSAEGSGLRGMRERALLIGADLDLRTPPGGGTRVRLRVPVASLEPA